MKKVRVLREMPFAKVGEEFELDCNSAETLNIKANVGRYSFTAQQISALVYTGWLSYVEEPKSLDNILHESLYQYIGSSGCLALERKIRTHTLEVFDRARKDWNSIKCDERMCNAIRQSLSEGK